MCESGRKDGGVLLLPAYSSSTNLEPGECPRNATTSKAPYSAL